ncbi:MAG TPA: lipopolysaccharide kinase InaA family protein [Candidatus Brocadiia bacterium]|nr:lipopolysaccharide kinase InaA family protein [Candidatus Brocadiales bacterium]
MAEEILTSFTNIKHNGVEWTIRSEYLTPIMNEFVETQNLASLHGQAIVGKGVKIIKSNKARTTLSAPFVNGQRVVVKRYHDKGWLERIKYLFRPSRAKAEWDMMNALLDKGISTCIPLAYGERRRLGFLVEGSLIVKEIPNCLSFQAYIKQYCSGTLSKEKVLLKRILLKKLADFIKHIHENNIDHGDFHGDNILLTEIDSDNPGFHLIDLHKARICRRLSLRRRIDDLARIIDIDTPKNPLSKTDCLRLIKHYKTFGDKKDFKRFASKVLNRAEIHRNKRTKSSTRWCLKLSDVFSIYKTKDIKIYYRKEYKLADILDLLKRIANYPENGKCRILKRSSKSVVFLEEIPLRGWPKKVVAKYNFYRGFFDMLKKTFIGTRSRKAWIAANGLIIRGIATPQPIALIEKKYFGFTRDNLLLTEYIDGSLHVNDYVSKYFNNNPSASGGLEMIKKKRFFIEELARLVKSFHDTGFYHYDLCGVNILVKEGSASGGENWEMFIIDLDSVSLWKKLTLKRRLKTLSQINGSFDCITNTDRVRFFKTYFGSLPPKAHEYIREIAKHAEVRRLRKLRRKRNRPIYGTRWIG